MTKPTTLILLGGSGDLSARLLMPALGQLLTERSDRRVTLIGVGSEKMSDEQWKDRVRQSFQTTESTGKSVDSLVKETMYVAADVTDPDALSELLGRSSGAPAIYFALPPQVTEKACVALESVEIPPGTVLAMEKPFGLDAESARQLNEQLLRLVPEDQIHRVDHFLGRSTVLNLLGLRFANRVFEPLWNRDHIDSVAVVYDEQLGLEGRAGYYDHAGALVDMIQSHLLQVLSIFAMEAPYSTDAADLRAAKSAVLRATRVRDNDPLASSRRARYTEGTVAGRHFPSYADEPDVDPERGTETLAQVTFEIDNWRWAGVPFTLRSGKAIGERRREILVRFKPAPHIPVGLTGSSEPDVLRISLGPDEMSLAMNVNGPGDPWELDRTELTATFGEGQLKAYGEVLESMLDGDPSLSVRGDAAEQMWRIVDPIIEAWRADEVSLDEYETGSNGPASWPTI
ncbi:glucose-6-phosphate dehydrogenase [Paramicrobacterium chengjingii]|uniref:Glucose-6-phosphate 1-dehydrogenase n=1 Tax=Paramicrobacterium chengjingii TaxID=2769067 RepID=A0ABX6YLQ4_9MICO|nr:glucose-6-phosphate dehydrogenase [Microbacterium chengjingii]QPZ39748.1 glucose-6-phosphate dehydrogenase [Microbacterium chengjingii]